jgi:hypothetical protein
MLLGLSSLICAEILVHTWPNSAFYHLPARGWELLAGALLAMGITPRITSTRLAETLSALGLALMVTPVFLYDNDTVFPGATAIPPVMGCALVIYATSNFQTRAGQFLSLPPMLFIGRISYSLYLWHWPVFVLPAYLMVRDTTPAETTVLIGMAVLLAAISWRFVEQPFRKKRQAAASAPLMRWPTFLAALPPCPLPPCPLPLTRSAYAAIALAACLIVSGSYFQSSKGAGWRLPDILSQTVHNVEPTSCRARTIGTELFECTFGDETPQNPKVVLWGDSHAEHYALTVAQTYKHLKLYYQPACAPILNVQPVSPGMPEAWKTCKANKTKIFERILSEKPAIVILGGKWTFWETLPPWKETTHQYYLTVNSNQKMTLENNNKIFYEELKNTVRALTDHGIKVILMGQAPELPNNLDRCLLNSYYFNDTKYSCLYNPRSIYEHRQKYANYVLESISKLNKNVLVFWPAPHLCSDTICSAFRDGKILYRDHHHLSSAGAMALAEGFRTSLSPVFLPTEEAASGQGPTSALQ